MHDPGKPQKTSYSPPGVDCAGTHSGLTIKSLTFEYYLFGTSVTTGTMTSSIEIPPCWKVSL